MDQWEPDKYVESTAPCHAFGTRKGGPICTGLLKRPGAGASQKHVPTRPCHSEGVLRFPARTPKVHYSPQHLDVALTASLLGGLGFVIWCLGNACPLVTTKSAILTSNWSAAAQKNMAPYWTLVPILTPQPSDRLAPRGKRSWKLVRWKFQRAEQGMGWRKLLYHVQTLALGSVRKTWAIKLKDASVDKQGTRISIYIYMQICVIFFISKRMA